MLKIYGHPGSTCTRKVLTALRETDLDYDFYPIDFATGAHKKPEHLARQPFGQVPAIDDSGFALYESRAICRYLNEKAGGSLVPSDLQGRARMEQWISIETSNFSAHAMKFVYEYIFRRPQGEEVLAKATAGLDTALGVMDQRLGEVPFLAGPTFSIADIGFMPYFEYDLMTPAADTFKKYPNVMAWWTRVSARPSWQQVTGKIA